MTTIPPSPVVICLLAKKLKVDMSPKLPQGLPLYLSPKDSAESSIILILFFTYLNYFIKIRTQTINVYKNYCFSFFVIKFIVSSVSIFQVCGSQSTRMGFAQSNYRQNTRNYCKCWKNNLITFFEI